MNLAAHLVSVTLALVMVTAAGGKLVRATPVLHRVERLGVGERWLPVLAIVEIAGGVGLLVGLWTPVVSIAAAALLIVYLLVALAFQVRVRDEGIASSSGFLMMAGAILVLRLLPD